MDALARQQYLSSQVLTASPQRLQLLLVDGALRFAQRLRDAIERSDAEGISEAGARCREILTEVLTSIRRDQTELTTRLRSIYFFLVREVGEAQFKRDAGRADGVIRVLSIERETWQEACTAAEAQTPIAPAPNTDATPHESFSIRC